MQCTYVKLMWLNMNTNLGKDITDLLSSNFFIVFYFFSININIIFNRSTRCKGTSATNFNAKDP